MLPPFMGIHSVLLVISRLNIKPTIYLNIQFTLMVSLEDRDGQLFNGEMTQQETHQG